MRAMGLATAAAAATTISGNKSAGSGFSVRDILDLHPNQNPSVDSKNTENHHHNHSHGVNRHHHHNHNHHHHHRNRTSGGGGDDHQQQNGKIR